jgi:23S rRNA (pseudouridine1915-N3)-methyltransferase
MYKIKIYTIGKSKDPWLIAALSEYEERLKGKFTFEWHLFKKESDLAKIEREPSYLCLDLKGTPLTSEKFSHLLFHELCTQGLNSFLENYLNLFNNIQYG